MPYHIAKDGKFEIEFEYDGFEWKPTAPAGPIPEWRSKEEVKMFGIHMFPITRQVHIVTDVQAETARYTCECSDKGYECDHIKEVISGRKDAPYYSKLIEEERRAIIALPLSYDPALLHPVVVQGNGVTAEVAHPGFVNERLNFDEHYLTSIVSGEGSAAILASLQDAFSAFHMDKSTWKDPAYRYSCSAAGHGMKQNGEMQERLGDKDSRGQEMMRISLTGECTSCAKRALKNATSAGEAFGDLIPDLGPAKPFAYRAGGSDPKVPSASRPGSIISGASGITVESDEYFTGEDGLRFTIPATTSDSFEFDVRPSYEIRPPYQIVRNVDGTFTYIDSDGTKYKVREEPSDALKSGKGGLISAVGSKIADALKKKQDSTKTIYGPSLPPTTSGVDGFSAHIAEGIRRDKALVQREMDSKALALEIEKLNKEIIARLPINIEGDLPF